MFLFFNSFLVTFSLLCGSCYNLKPEDNPLTIDTEVKFLHKAIKLPAGVPEENLNKIKETLNTYDNLFMEIEKGVNYCKFDSQTNNCTTKLEELKQNLLNEIQMLQRQKREKPQFWFKPHFSKCFVCMSAFVNRTRNILDNYVVHFKLIFMIDNKNPNPDEDKPGSDKPNPNPTEPNPDASSTPSSTETSTSTSTKATTTTANSADEKPVTDDSKPMGKEE